MLAMATFDVNSVNVWAAKQTMNSNTNGGKSFRPVREFPNIADMPDRLPPSANAKPPPNKKIKLHGTFALMYFHVMSPCDGAVGSLAVKWKFKKIFVENFTRFGFHIQGLLLKKFKHPQLAGIMNSAMTTKMAGVASLIFVFVNNSAQPVMKPGARVKNRTTDRMNKKATHFSCGVIGPNSLYLPSITDRATRSPSGLSWDSLASLPVRMRKDSIMSEKWMCDDGITYCSVWRDPCRATANTPTSGMCKLTCLGTERSEFFFLFWICRQSYPECCRTSTLENLNQDCPGNIAHKCLWMLNWCLNRRSYHNRRASKRMQHRRNSKWSLSLVVVVRHLLSPSAYPLLRYPVPLLRTFDIVLAGIVVHREFFVFFLD